MFVSVIVCILIQRFALAIAAGGRERLARGPVALAPEPGREQLIGEASASAEALGVRAGMRMGEALARCPELQFVAPDPAGVADAWDEVVTAIEAIGAAVEAGAPGVLWFDAHALRHVHGPVDRVIAAARRAVAQPVRAGAGPTRFAAYAAASRSRPRRAEVLGGSPEQVRAALAPLPVGLLRARPETAALPDLLERFGVRTLGDVAALPRTALADRLGEAGPLARDLARGRDRPLVPRTAVERLEELLPLHESASGPQLERALALLVDRLLARRERRGRTLRAVVLSAALVEGGTWREQVTFREALADPHRMRLVLAQRLAELPAPAQSLRLRVEGFGPVAGAQRSLLEEAAAIRRGRLREAVRQARAVAGPDAALRVLMIDPDSRVPERRAVLAPWEP